MPTIPYNEYMPKRLSFSEQLRRAMERSEKTRYRMSIETGIAQSNISRFFNHKGTLSQDSIDKLCDCLDLRLVESKPKSKGK